MGSSVNNIWIFDSLVGFLKGPVWQAPIQTFIEEHCEAFDDKSTSINFQQKLFEEYSNMVDLLLGSYMEDLGITHDQFEEACSFQQNQALAEHFDYNTFEQIWAANDFELFKRMMIQKNLEIQLQALKLVNENMWEEISETDFESSIHDKQKDNDEINVKADGEISKIRENNTSVKSQLPPLKHRDKRNSLEKDEVIKYSQNTDQNSDNNKIKKLEEEWNLLTSTSHKNKISSAEIKKRQEYLRTQRDKLIALKKGERKLKFSKNVEECDKKKELRPKSSRAAESLLTGSHASDIQQTLKIRKHLAERLRKELISNNKE